MNRKMIVFTTLVIGLFMTSIIGSGGQNLSNSYINDEVLEGIIDTDKNWEFADLPEGAIITYDETGTTIDYRNGTYTYTTSVGERNTYDEIDGTWHRYLYDADTRTVKIGNLTITHLAGGALSIDGDAGSRVGRLSWYIQAYYDEDWQNITLSNYEFVGFTKTADNITMHQRFWDVQGEMNVYLTYSYFGGFKTRVDITNNAAIDLPIRAIWAAQNVGIQDNYELLYNRDSVLYGIQIEDAAFTWNDVLASDNPLPTRTVIDKPNRRAAVIFGNQTTIVPSGYTATIDPTYTVAADGDDNYWDVSPSNVAYDSATTMRTGMTTYYSYWRVALAIPRNAEILSANAQMYQTSGLDAGNVYLERIAEATCNVIEGRGSPPPIDATPVSSVWVSTSAGWFTWSTNMADLVEEQVLGGWDSGDYIGVRLRSADTHYFADVQGGTGNYAKMTIVWNIAPVVSVPTCSNLDDTDNLYAKRWDYQIQEVVTDVNGYTDIDTVQIILMNTAETIAYWEVWYDEDTNVFTEAGDSNDYITLNTGGSTYVKSVNTLTVTFYVTINWNHPDISDTHFYVRSDDTSGTYNDEFYSSTLWDVETRLDDSAFTLDDGSGTATRGNYDTIGGIESAGVIDYLGSNLHPPANSIDVFTNCITGTATTHWEAVNYEGSGGTFSVDVDSDDVIGLDTYHLYAVEEGGEWDDTNLIYAGDPYVDYIADRIQVQSYSSDDARIDINTAAADHVTLYYDYLDQIVTTGTWTVNGITLTYSGASGIWNFGDTKSSAQGITYNTVADSGVSKDDTYGISLVEQNSQSLLQIWDQVRVVSYTIVTPSGDNRNNIGTTYTIDVELHYDYDETDVTTGTVTINGLTGTYQSLGKWRFTDMESIVMGTTYNNVQSSGNAYDLTVEDNTVTQLVIWDAIGIYMWIDDGRDNIDDNIIVYAWLTYMYDMTNVTDGTVLLNGTGMSYGSSIWSLARTQSTAGLYAYNITTISGNTHGITAIGMNVFDDTSTTYVNFGSDNFDTPEYITVAAWVSWSALPTGGIISTIAEKGNQAANTHWLFGLYDHSGTSRLYWELGNGTTRNTVGITSPSTAWTPNLNQWYHIVGTYDT